MQQLERELAGVFRRRADGVPAGAVARICARDYHPRTRRRTPLVTGGAIAGAVATTATVATVVSVVSSPAAFAGWNAAPSTSSGSTSAVSTCRSQLAQPPGAPSTLSTTWRLVATDVRGPYTLVVFDGSTGSSEATCLSSTTPSVTSVWAGGRSGTAGWNMVGESSSGAVAGKKVSAVSATPFSGLAPMTELHALASGQGAYTLVDGQVPSTVTSVTLVRSDGNSVQATTADGWFVAWWPGTGDATSAELTSPSGTTSEPLDFTPPGNPCPSAPTPVESSGTKPGPNCSGTGAATGGTAGT